MRSFDVLIVGGGASGTLVASQLLRRSRSSLRIALIERTGVFSRGPAYGTDEPSHLLNVRAGVMGAWPDAPGHFLEALRADGLSVDGSEFVSRGRYGEYLERVLSDAQAGAADGVRCFKLVEEVVAIERGARGLVAVTASGEQLQAPRVLLATGNTEPSTLQVPDGGVFTSQAWVGAPWQSEWMDALHPDDDVLIVGTSLTSVDVVLSLLARGHRGHVTAISRHGLLPRPHLPTAKALIWKEHTFPSAMRALLRSIRVQVERRTLHDDSWQDALDALRPHHAGIWQQLPLLERRRFLRHVRSRWDVVRHRMAPEIAEVIREALERGQLEVVGGRLLRLEPEGDGLVCRYRRRVDGVERSVRSRRGVNCTGPASPVASRDPLFASLLNAGLAVEDPLGLGIVTRGGAVVDRDGRAQQDLRTIGSLRRGELWESVAIPEIRAQAAEVAQAWLEEEPGRS